MKFLEELSNNFVNNLGKISIYLGLITTGGILATIMFPPVGIFVAIAVFGIGIGIFLTGFSAGLWMMNSIMTEQDKDDEDDTEKKVDKLLKVHDQTNKTLKAICDFQVAEALRSARTHDDIGEIKEKVETGFELHAQNVAANRQEELERNSCNVKKNNRKNEMPKNSNNPNLIFSKLKPSNDSFPPEPSILLRK